ncbi:hypothetical protein [Cetobacterium sp. ZOR0034]|uniref:hypothetical protein n=1 Tax=Cetobacterium sp. ZOR0034 TaxID=1339239 RepID=UPI0006458A77|nr:hypothetical protein [Cetobacterium sp. ZOR0034]
MRSFALWYNPRKKEETKIIGVKNKDEIETESKVCLDIHVNLWRNKKKDTFIFDFGLMVSEIQEVEEICIYIPFEIEKIEDLGRKMKANNSLINAIFNEECEIDSSHPNRVKVKRRNSEECFMVYSIHDSEYEIQKIENTKNTKGTILKLNVGKILSKVEENLDSTKKYYFRIRFEQNSGNINMIKNQTSEQNIYSNFFKKIEMIDFRINDERTWSETIKQEYYRSKNFVIKSIHYLLLRNANDEFIYYDGKIKSRLLEVEIWKDYIEFIDTDTITYHIKKIANDNQELGIENFICLTRFKFTSESVSLLIYYLIFVLFLAIIANSIFGFFNTFLSELKIIKDNNISPEIIILTIGFIICISVYFLIKKWKSE